MNQSLHCTALVVLAACGTLIAGRGSAEPLPPTTTGQAPSAFATIDVRVNGTSLHVVRGGRGPAVILLHGFPQDWIEYQAIMPRLARRYTTVAVDLPGIGHSAPSANGYAAADLSDCLHSLAKTLDLKQAYVVGHDLGALVTYAYIRRFPDSLRGAMILDAPMPGLAGWEQATADAWHVGFIQAPGLAEKLVPGRQDAFLGWFLDLGKFTPDERDYTIKVYGEPQLHAAFEMYRALPQDAQWNAAQTTPNSVPLIVAVGEKSFLASLLPTFVAGYRARGMTQVESSQIPNAGHYLLADNPESVADLIERHAGGRSR